MPEAVNRRQGQEAGGRRHETERKIFHISFVISHLPLKYKTNGEWAFRVPTLVGFLSTKSPTEVGTLNAHFATRVTMPAMTNEK